MASALLSLIVAAAAAQGGPLVVVKPPPGASAPPVVGIAPALTVVALRDELRAASARRQEELAAIAKQRAEVQKIAAEIAAARTSLEAEKGQRGKDDRSERAPEKRELAPRVETRTATAPTSTSPEALAKTVKGMKADQAAALVQRLDRGLAVEVMRRMRPADAGAILDKMKGETAAELFSQMAAAKPIPNGAGVR